MLVILPVCHKDEHLALLNLQLCLHLDGGPVEFDCLVTTDRSFDARNVVSEASKYFRKVKLHKYDPCPYEKKWPHQENWAWQQSARHVHENYKEPWLWWEQDAVPVKAGWLDALASAHKDGGGLYSGPVVTSTRRYLVGVAIYPPNAALMMQNAIITRMHPFDIVGSVLDRVLPKTTDISHLIQHEVTEHGESRHWNKNDVGNIPSTVVLHHRCEDGSLQEALLESGGIEAAPIHASGTINPSDITVVITTHARLDKLERCLRSCYDAGVQDENIVVSATGYVGRAVQKLKGLCAGVPLVNNKNAPSNDAWIAGVRAAKTKWVQILHDDDGLLKNYLLGMCNAKDSSFVLFSSRFFYEGDAAPSNNLCGGPAVVDGWRDSSEVSSFVNTEGNLAISPVRGLFQREDLIQWLEEAGSRLPEACMWRPGFLVGNDLWIYLSASKKYSNYTSISAPLTFLGHHKESTTVDAMSSKDGAARLVSIYDLTRKEFNRQPMAEVKASTTHLNILTIVLDGAPFLMAQLACFNRLKVPWHWYIVEGVACANDDTGWCKGIRARHSDESTMEILKGFSCHPRITVMSEPRWHSKTAMVNAPLLGDTAYSGILLQVDVDESWLPSQIEAIVDMFDNDRSRDHALFWCRYFVGPHAYTNTLNGWANNPAHSWKRAWRYQRGQQFKTHEPPVLTGSDSSPFTHQETLDKGLVFDHYGYALQSQVKFKEEYYGYANAVVGWQNLQFAPPGTRLSGHMSWVHGDDELLHV